MRPIDADTLKDKARELIPHYRASVVMNLFDLIDNLADNMPTIDEVPVGAYKQALWERDMAIAQLEEIGKSLGETMDDVKPKKGKWIEREKYRTTRDGIFHTYRFKVCSECGRASGRRMNRPTRFCPNCGARMERSEE